MRYLICKDAMRGILLAAILGMTGCASTPQSVSDTKAWLSKNESVIKSAVKLVRKVAIRYSVNDPVKAATVNSQIDTVAFQVSSLLATGAFDPDSVAKALKANDPGVMTALDALNVVYSAAYTELQNRDQVQLAIIILRDIADGLAPTTTPPTADLGRIEFFGRLCDGA